MPYRHFPPIYGRYDEATVLNEKQLKELLKLNDEDTCADWYGHYSICYNAVIEGKGRHLRDAIKQITTTASRLRAIGRPVQKAIIVADTFGNEIGLYRRGKDLCQKRGATSVSLYVETLNGRVPIEGWQPSEWGRNTIGT